MAPTTLPEDPRPTSCPHCGLPCSPSLCPPTAEPQLHLQVQFPSALVTQGSSKPGPRWSLELLHPWNLPSDRIFTSAGHPWNPKGGHPAPSSACTLASLDPFLIHLVRGHCLGARHQRWGRSWPDHRRKSPVVSLGEGKAKTEVGLMASSLSSEMFQKLSRVGWG